MADDNKQITVYHRQPGCGYPSGKNIFYLCTGCREIIQGIWEPEPGTACRCGNIFFDVGRISIRSDDQLIILKQE